MALANELLLILADDLIGNLDPKTGEKIMRLFVKPPKEGRTILMLSHDTNIAAYSQRTIRFLAGRPTFSLTLPLSRRKGPLTAFGPEEQKPRTRMMRHAVIDVGS